MILHKYYTSITQFNNAHSTQYLLKDNNIGKQKKGVHDTSYGQDAIFSNREHLSPEHTSHEVQIHQVVLELNTQHCLHLYKNRV